MVYGFARVSSKDQNLNSQIEALNKFGVDEIVHEKISGVLDVRPEFNKLMEKLQPGDTLVVARMDRLARSLKHLIDIVDELEKKGVDIVTLDYQFDTRTSTGRMLFHIIAAVSQWEREMLKEKQRAGIETAKKEGKHLGRPKKYKYNKKLKEAFMVFKKGERTVTDICDTFEIPRATFYRYLKEFEQ